ncbi:MAG TPA: DUF885 domain-containing protein [Candidatus Krumholzibacteria bacterium]|nr:DUF885 domain-containing protein [Candidatus Krumholzibacteria bacterium]
MKKFLLVLSMAMVVAVGFGCSKKGGAKKADAAFETLANAYIETLLQMNPESATLLGDHRFDDRLNDRTIAGVTAQASANEEYLAKLQEIDRAQLSDANAVDYDIMKLNLERGIFEALELREHEWNPLYYNMGGAVYSLVAREFAPIEQRLASVEARVRAIPTALAAAKAQLQNPPKVFTETAILQNQGNISLLKEELAPFIQQAPAMEAQLKPAIDASVAALEEYGTWLEKDLLPRSNGEFRLGDEKWRRKLRFSLDSDLSKEDILARATVDLQATQQAMYATALPLYKKFFPEVTDESKLGDVKHVNKAVLDKLAEDRPDSDRLIHDAQVTLNAAIAFTREKKLVTVPSEPVKIIVMPEFQRGVAVAYCETPGPLEPEGATLYAISPPPATWTPERTQSFFKEYNDYMLLNLTVHEAVPGHYLQGTHSNKFKAPTLVRAIFYSGSFAEGWAVYTEKVMADAGFGGDEVRMQQLKMRLRVIINAIIDQKIHTEGMTEEEAMALMMNEGFQEEGEAAGKWRRACLTSTQLSTYFVGSAEVEDIRKAYEAKHPNPDLLALHDQMLSYGTPAPKYVKRMMGL